MTYAGDLSKRKDSMLAELKEIKHVNIKDYLQNKQMEIIKSNFKNKNSMTARECMRSYSP